MTASALAQLRALPRYLLPDDSAIGRTLRRFGLHPGIQVVKCSDLDAVLAALGEPPASPQIEVCLCAAIKMEDGYVIRGHRHDDAIMCAAGMPRYKKADLHKAVQGFLTSAGRFVDRTEGAAVQRAAGVVSAHTGRFTDYLFSEDLYLFTSLGDAPPPPQERTDPVRACSLCQAGEIHKECDTVGVVTPPPTKRPTTALRWRDRQRPGTVGMKMIEDADSAPYWGDAELYNLATGPLSENRDELRLLIRQLAAKLYVSMKSFQG